MSAEVVDLRLARLSRPRTEIGAVETEIHYRELGVFAAIAHGVSIAEARYALQTVGFDLIKREGVYVLDRIPLNPEGQRA